MPLMTIADVQRELGLQSRQSIYNLVHRGELKLLRLRITGKRGVPRIDAAEVESLKRRLGEETPRDSSGPAAVSSRVAPRRRSKQTVMHFE